MLILLGIFALCAVVIGIGTYLTNNGINLLLIANNQRRDLMLRHLLFRNRKIVLTIENLQSALQELIAVIAIAKLISLNKGSTFRLDPHLLINVRLTKKIVVVHRIISRDDVKTTKPTTALVNSKTKFTESLLNQEEALGGIEKENAVTLAHLRKLHNELHRKILILARIEKIRQLIENDDEALVTGNQNLTPISQGEILILETEVSGD